MVGGARQARVIRRTYPSADAVATRKGGVYSGKVAGIGRDSALGRGRSRGLLGCAVPAREDRGAACRRLRSMARCSGPG